MLQRLVFDLVFKEGDLTVIDSEGNRARYGDRTGPPVTIRMHDSKLPRDLLLNPKLAVGEAYMDERLTIEEGTLIEFLDLCGRNVHHLETHPVWSGLEGLSRNLRHVRSFNPVGRAQRNAKHHYDLSGELYQLFLDRDLQYSCAYFASADDSLDEAQGNKKRHIAAKLLLDRPGLRVLDIGSGWGGLGLYLHNIAQAEVTGLTLSTEQHQVSNERARQSGIDSQVRFDLRDYRDQSGQFDRIVSVGMFEHVGTRHYRSFFRRVRELLKEDGVALLHSIGRFDPPGGTNPWIRKYIFPGGYVPALSEVMTAVEKEGLVVTDIEILRLHYAETLKNWRVRFNANRDKVRSIYDERFCRMWDFYLAGCETAFRRLGQMVFQMQLARRQDAVPLTRDYITDWERAQALQGTRAAE